jgi:hypothetical protein
MADDATADAAATDIRSDALRRLNAALLAQATAAQDAAAAIADLHVALGLGPIDKPVDPPLPTDDTTTIDPPAPPDTLDGGDDTDGTTSPPPVPDDPPTPNPKPTPPALSRMVNGKSVPLRLYGMAGDFKFGADTQGAISRVAYYTRGMYMPGCGPDVFGIFMGREKPEYVTPNANIPGDLLSYFAKQKLWAQLAYPVVFMNNTGPDKFRRVIAGCDDKVHRQAAQWFKDSGASLIIRLAWERNGHSFNWAFSDNDGTHYDPNEVMQACYYVMGILNDGCPTLLYSDSLLRQGRWQNGPGKPTTILEPDKAALDKTKVHMAGADIYLPKDGTGSPADSLDSWAKVGDRQIPNSLMSYGLWAKGRGLPACFDEVGSQGHDVPEFWTGLWQRVEVSLPEQGVDVATVIAFQGNDNRMLDGTEPKNLAAFRSTFGSRKSRHGFSL